jgi:SAM-dependent methyltransferase
LTGGKITVKNFGRFLFSKNGIIAGIMSSSERFAYEWSKFDKIIPEYEIQFLKWVYPLKKEDFKDKIILDAGCGIGRNSHWPLKYGAKKIAAFDFDRRTVAVARRNLSAFSNVEVKEESIYNINYNDEFDIVFSIGVIHHLERPRDAILKLVQALKKGGLLLIWVYAREGNERLIKFINPLRKILSQLPPFATNIISYLFAVPLFFYLKLIPRRHPYFKQLAGFKFWHIRSIVLDQLLPKIANYWRKEEALGLLEDKGLKNIQIYPVNNNSWTVIGIKA